MAIFAASTFSSKLDARCGISEPSSSYTPPEFLPNCPRDCFLFWKMDDKSSAGYTRAPYACCEPPEPPKKLYNASVI